MSLGAMSEKQMPPHDLLRRRAWLSVRPQSWLAIEISLRHRKR
jgi:hypothetical protein